MTPDDIVGVMAIEQTLKSPWQYSQFLEELAVPQGWQFTAKSLIDHHIMGYICGTVVIDESEIRKIAVETSARRMGVAGCLLESSFNLLSRQGVANCYLELRESNSAALNLYIKNFFHKTGLRKSYYTNPIENAIILNKQFNLSQETGGEEHKRT